MNLFPDLDYCYNEQAWKYTKLEPGAIDINYVQ